MKKNTVFTILIAIIAVSVFLRLYHINDTSLWLDEGVTAYMSSGESYSEVWDKIAKLDQSPPGYYLIMHTYLEFFGENEFGFRFIPLIFGILSILFLYLLASEMFNREIGLFAAMLLAINPFHIGFSIEGRMYVLLSLEALMAFYFLYKALHAEVRGYKWWILFIISCIFGIYTHNFYFFVLLALSVIFFVLLLSVKKKTPKLLLGILSAIIVSISYLPWLPSFLKQMQTQRYWMASNAISNVREYFESFANQNEYIFFTFIIIAVFGAFWIFFRRKSLDYKKNIFSLVSVILFLIIGLGAPLAYSLLFEPILKIRYVVYLVPIWVSVVAVGIYALRRFTVIFPIIIFGVFIFFLSPWKMSAYPVEVGEDYRGLVNIVSNDPAPMIVHTPSVAYAIGFYNKGKFDVKPFPFSDDLTKFNIDETYSSKFRDLVKNYKSFYLVVTHSHENPEGLLYNWSNSFCKKSYEISIKGMKTYYFDECT